jgi:hypothetical protein
MCDMKTITSNRQDGLIIHHYEPLHQDAVSYRKELRMALFTLNLSEPCSSCLTWPVLED